MQICCFAKDGDLGARMLHGLINPLNTSTRRRDSHGRLSSLLLSTHLHRFLATKVRDATPRVIPPVRLDAHDSERSGQWLLFACQNRSVACMKNVHRSKVKFSAWIRQALQRMNSNE